jgi:hypothetical protein
MTNVFTIVSCNYLAEARVLMDSVRECLPEARRTVFFIDDWKGKFDPAAEDFECVAACDASMPRYRHFAFAYSPGEFCFALKPFCVRYLFDHGDAEQMIYVDSDMLFLARPSDLLETLAWHPIVLTPHKLRATGRTEHFNIVRAGAFNAGFLALSRASQADEFMAWWGKQMIEPGNLAQDWFFDQGWLDLVPAYFPDTAILRHPGYNVAFWNVVERRVERGALLEDHGATGPQDDETGMHEADSMREEPGGRRSEVGGRTAETGDRRSEAEHQKSEPSGARQTGGKRQPRSGIAGWRDQIGNRRAESGEGGGRRAEGASWKVVFGSEEYPLVLFHFSMFDHRFPDRISGEIDYAGTGPNEDLDALLRDYVSRLKDRGLEECHRWPYDHGFFTDGKPVTKDHRCFFKQRWFHETLGERDPFDPAMEPRGLGSLYHVDHPVARFTRRLKGVFVSAPA